MVLGVCLGRPSQECCNNSAWSQIDTSIQMFIFSVVADCQVWKDALSCLHPIPCHIHHRIHSATFCGIVICLHHSSNIEKVGMRKWFVAANMKVFMRFFILYRIVQEKQTGVKELMKMMGMPSWMNWIFYLFDAMISLVVSIAIMTAIASIEWASGGWPH